MASTSTSTSTFSTVSITNTLTNTSNAEVHDESDSWEDATSPRITFLSVFIGFGFLGNLFLIITICHSRRFRSVAFYIFVSNLAIANICECVLNMTVLLSVTITNAWTFGNIPCKVSAFFLHLICVETILALMILTTDRLIAVRFKDKYDHVFSTPRISILICYTWFQSLSFSIPVAVGAVPTSANVYIKHCSITKGGSIAYGIISTLLCLIVPLVLMIVFFVKIIRTGYKDRMLIRSLISQHNYKDESQPEPRIKTEIRYTNITGTLCLAWLVMFGPYAVTLYFNILQNSSEVDDMADSHVKYVWYVDLVLLWLRFSFTLVLPIAAFTWSKELWKSFKDMILCRKNNAIIDESFKKNETDTQKLERKINEEQKREKEKEKEEVITTAREQRVFHVPVLFATSHGVHIRTEADDSDSETSESKNGGTLRGKKCDVIGSQDNINNFGDDTSDYDTGTEMDPFSVSHPVSVRQLNDIETLSGRHRSSSHPEVRGKLTKSYVNGSVTVGSSSAGDSGLDLSSGIVAHTLKSSISRDKDKDLPISMTETLDQTDVKGSGPVSDGVCNTEKRESVDMRQDMNDVVPFSIVTEDKNIDVNVIKQNTVINQGTVIGENMDTEVEKLQSIESVSIDSPVPKRRKKKRKDKIGDVSSQGTASPILPLRPPPRLAPITSNIKTFNSGPGRPGSSCSSQYSALDNPENVPTSGLNSESYPDLARADLTSLDNLSLSSFTARNKHPSSTLKYSNNPTEINHENVYSYLECNKGNREIRSVPEEVLTPNENHVTALSTENDQYFNDNANEYEEKERNIIAGSVEGKPPLLARNSDARKKRRDRIVSNGILNEGKGYTRLKTDS